MPPSSHRSDSLRRSRRAAEPSSPAAQRRALLGTLSRISSSSALVIARSWNICSAFEVRPFTAPARACRLLRGDSEALDRSVEACLHAQVLRMRLAEGGQVPGELLVSLAQGVDVPSVRVCPGAEHVLEVVHALVQRAAIVAGLLVTLQSLDGALQRLAALLQGGVCPRALVDLPVKAVPHQKLRVEDLLLELHHIALRGVVDLAGEVREVLNEPLHGLPALPPLRVRARSVPDKFVRVSAGHHRGPLEVSAGAAEAHGAVRAPAAAPRARMPGPGAAPVGRRGVGPLARLVRPPRRGSCPHLLLGRCARRGRWRLPGRGYGGRLCQRRRGGGLELARRCRGGGRRRGRERAGRPAGRP
mmetsp:Transcript_12616/g.39778  ORF Transcript_12616/g.39778 Transcript_12616/m.39778 type:complete len:359 (-) Transcript_12616:192-1268(-)